MAAQGDIVVVHSSDLHIDADYFPGRVNSWRTGNLDFVLGTASRVEADIVLLAGDTFDSHRQPPELVAMVSETIASSGKQVVVLPGNHDPVISGAVYQQLLSNGTNNLSVIGVTHEEAVTFEKFELEIWGRAHRSYDDMDPFDKVRARRTRWQIAMAHGHYESKPNRKKRYRASWLIGDADLAATGADYVALGHWNRAVEVGDGKVPAHYSGSPDYTGSVNVIRLKAGGDVVVERTSVLGKAR